MWHKHPVFIVMSDANNIEYQLILQSTTDTLGKLTRIRLLGCGENISGQTGSQSINQSWMTVKFLVVMTMSEELEKNLCNLLLKTKEWNKKETIKLNWNFTSFLSHFPIIT